MRASGACNDHLSTSRPNYISIFLSQLRSKCNHGNPNEEVSGQGGKNWSSEMRKNWLQIIPGWFFSVFFWSGMITSISLMCFRVFNSLLGPAHVGSSSQKEGGGEGRNGSLNECVAHKRDPDTRWGHKWNIKILFSQRLTIFTLVWQSKISCYPLIFTLSSPACWVMQNSWQPAQISPAWHVPDKKADSTSRTSEMILSFGLEMQILPAVQKRRRKLLLSGEGGKFWPER